jgi:hypothetical protein
VELRHDRRAVFGTTARHAAGADDTIEDQRPAANEDVRPNVFARLPQHHGAVTARDDILAALPSIVARSVDGSFQPQDVIDELRRRGSAYAESTIRTHVVSRMCADAPDHHARTYDDLERLAHGRYRLAASPRPVAGQRPWAIRLTLLACDAELDQIVERIGAAICESPDHLGPCANPWVVTATPVDDIQETERSTWLPSVDELLEQRRAEHQR